MIIHPEIRITGFDARAWWALVELFLPAERREASDEAGILFVLESEDGEPLLAHHTKLGRLRGVPRAASPATLRRLYLAERCVVLREGAIEELEQRVALRLSPTDDLASQILMVGQAAREMMHGGLIRVDPKLPTLPLPGPGVLRRTLDLLLPIGHSALLCAWVGGEIDTALCVHRGPGGIDALLGPRWLEAAVGPLGGDFRRDYRIVNEAVADELGPLVIAAHAQTPTLRALFRAPDPGAWASSAATRELIVRPMPPYAIVALGADALHSVASRSLAWSGAVRSRNATNSEAVRSRNATNSEAVRSRNAVDSVDAAPTRPTPEPEDDADSTEDT
jgi:hypothetical protein